MAMVKDKNLIVIIREERREGGEIPRSFIISVNQRDITAIRARNFASPGPKPVLSRVEVYLCWGGGDIIS